MKSGSVLEKPANFLYYKEIEESGSSGSKRVTDPLLEVNYLSHKDLFFKNRVGQGFGERKG